MEITRHYLCLSIFFFHSLMLCLTINAHTNITTDKHALLSLKSKISFDPHSILAYNWSVNSITPCNWIGVTCNSRHNRVTALDLSNMSLVGEFTPDLGNLSFLVSLKLSQNNFHNSFPRELSQLRRLKILQCSFNDFSGNIPSWFSLLPNLRFLYLGNNNISGFLPTSLFNLSKLEILHLGVNSLEGSVPREIGNLPQLKWLNLSFNHLSGSFPLGILNLSRLETLSLSSNTLFGELPLDLGNHLPKLQTFNMPVNKFSGQIPSSLSKCSLLQTISLPYNNFSGCIPREFGNLTKLEKFDLRSNQLTGAIPKEIGNLTALELLNFANNNLGGVIPKELGKLHRLEEVYLQFANLSGSIPKEVFNISSLKIISFGYNNLVGTLPSSMGHALLNLEELYLAESRLFGVIPDSISNCSKLTILVLAFNHFSGTLPASLGNLRLLEKLFVNGNMLTNDVASPELSIINSLVNCNYLEKVYLFDNPLDAILPSSIGNLSSFLEELNVSRCRLKGNIPNQLGNLSNLFALNLGSNNLVGFIPPMLGRASKLQALDLSNNKLSGSIPDSLCDLHYLYELFLSTNQLSGGLLKCFGNSTSLKKIYLDSNRLTSKIPSSLCSLKDLLELDLSSNFLDGFIPNDVGGLKALSLLDISYNQISGNIPITIGQLQNLVSLFLERNKLEGSIPEKISQIVSLKSLDLSLNKLSGSIPVSLEKLAYLKYFNVSFNELSGEIPSTGCFKNDFSSASFMFNKELCGNPRFHVPPCNSTHHSRIKKKLLIALASLGASLIITLVIIAFVLTKRQRKVRVLSMTDIGFPWDKLRISYDELSRATFYFSQNNLIGSGSFGSVYKGTLDDGMLIAVKVFNQSEDALESFNVEIEVLKNLRHRNLTKVITGCFADDFKALVLEYMPNRSLDLWLHSQRNFLDMVQRLNIMIDVACGLDYLHNGYTIPVVHCDLKPANVLLDEEMVAHVCDFSVTKLLTEKSFMHTETLATLGYMAPEYGSTGMISTQCDIYSFGIVVMETFSARRPTDETFGEDMSLKRWISDSLPHHVLQAVDPNLLRADDEDFNVKLQCISSILELALHCADESPQKRLNAKDVVARLNKIKLQFLRSVGS